MRIVGCWVGVWMGLAGFSAHGALDIRELEGVYEIVRDGEVVGTFWNAETGQSDVGFAAGAGVTPQFFWSDGQRYLAANGGVADNGQVFLYEIGDGTNWTPVAPPELTDEQLAPLQALGDWSGSGTEAVRWQQDDTLLMRVWARAAAPDGEAPGTASVWTDLEMDGAQSRIVGMSTEEPMAPDAVAAMMEGMPGMTAPPGDSAPVAEGSTPRLAAEALEGEHPVVGRNSDGSEYEGTVVIRAKGGLLLFQWTIGETVAHGTGLIADMTVGVALDNGMAIYQAMPQADGISLIGLWKPQGAKRATEETIFIGNADMTNADFAVRDVDGEWDFRRELPGEEPMEGLVTISGGDVAKELEWQFPDGNMQGEGLLLGEGLAVITPDGLAVYAIADADGSEFFAGSSVTEDARVLPETLTPAE